MEVAMAMPGEEGKLPCIDTHSDEMQVVSDDKLTMAMRKEAPTHYTLEIESFQNLQAILSESGFDRYESTEFTVDDLEWKLILYPGGDKEREGDGHISLYLKSLNATWRKINAILIFFVYDYNQNQFMSFQDGRVKQFDGEDAECGFSRLLPLADFNDTSKGYLSSNGGSCKFGVEVFVISSTFEEECFSPIVIKPNQNRFIWTIEKLSKKLSDSEPDYHSKEFTVGDCKWKLRIYPNGVAKVRGRFLSIYLCLIDGQNISFGSKMYTEFNLRIRNQLDESKKTEKRGKAWFSFSETPWGFPYFVKLSDLKETPGLIVEDILIVEAEISPRYVIKDFIPENNEMSEGIEEPPSPIYI